MPTYWIVNLIDRHLEVYTLPGPDGYQKCEIFGLGEHAAVFIHGIEVGSIKVEDLVA